MKRFTATVQQDENGELFLPLPQEMLDELNWVEGDKLKWVDNYNGSFTMLKVPTLPRKLVLVETVSSFRHRYVVELPEGKESWALDTVVMDECEELSQKHLDNLIVSHRTVTKEEVQKMFNDDNEMQTQWDLQKIYDNYVTKIDDNGNLIDNKKES